MPPKYLKEEIPFIIFLEQITPCQSKDKIKWSFTITIMSIGDSYATNTINNAINSEI